MPRKNKKGDLFMVIWIPQEMKDELKAIGYQIGLKGHHSDVARRLIAEGVERYKASLNSYEKGIFNTNLTNVKIASSLQPPPKRKINTYIKKRKRGGI